MNDWHQSELLEVVPDALILIDGAGRIVLSNSNAETLFGYPPQGMVGLSIEALMPEAVRSAHNGHREHYMAAPFLRAMGDTNRALVGQRLDGNQFPVEIMLSPASCEEGPGYFASIRDMSKTHLARQAKMRAGYDALIARIGHLALASADISEVFESVPTMLAEALHIEAITVALLRHDQEGIEMEASFGFSANWLQSLLGSEQSNGALWQAILQGKSILVEDTAHQRANEHLSPLPFAISGSSAVIPLLDREHPIGALIALSHQPHRFDHDAMHLLHSVANMLAALVQRRRSEEQMAHLHRLDAIGQLTGGIAHDFNNLLTIISGSLQLLDAECGRHPKAANLITGALRSVSRGAELTSKLLAFARRQRLSPGVIHPHQLLADLVVMLRHALGESIEIKVDCPDTVPAALADVAQLEAALVNLLLNARDAMPKGGEMVVSVSECLVEPKNSRPGLKPGEYVMFSVTDTGLGMAPETLARAIEPFYTTKGVGRGSGLGLSMVYGFASQSGGGLHIASRLGYGARVELYLPVAKSAAVKSTASVAGHATMQGDGQTVLVVEDEADVLAIAEAFLRSLGYRVIGVASAEEGLQKLAEDPTIAFLFSDVMLGNGMDGNDLARAARGMRPNLGVLLTSGYNDSNRSMNEDFELLHKPYKREQLAEALWRGLNAASA